jgi:TRAP transporter TAXI family solute receptor
LKECGLTEEDIEALPISLSEATQAMREKTIDAFFVTVGTPNKGLMDLQAEREITILGLSEDVITALLEKHPFYIRYTLTENDYSFLKEPVNTVAVKTTLVAAASLSTQAAYDLVKVIIENSDKIAVAHAKGMYVSAEGAVEGLPLELHEGARRYFLEIGVITEPPESAKDAEGIE